MASEDQQKWQEASSHVLCANNCGFFGSPTTLNLCSKCYKDHCLKDHQISSAKIAVENTFSTPESSPPVKISGEDKLLSPRHQSTHFSPESGSLGSELAVNETHAPGNDVHATHAPLVDFQSSHAPSSDFYAPEIIVHAQKISVQAPVSEEKEEVVRKRCGSCNKRVGLTGFTCKCGTLFCGTHRYPEKHECSFDFKTVGKEAIKRENPVVKASKLDRI